MGHRGLRINNHPDGKGMISMRAVADFQEKQFASLIADVMQEVQISNGAYLKPDLVWSNSPTASRLKKRDPQYRAALLNWLFDEIVGRDSAYEKKYAGTVIKCLTEIDPYPGQACTEAERLMFVFQSMLKARPCLGKDDLMKILSYALAKRGGLKLLHRRQWPIQRLIKMLAPMTLSAEDKRLLQECTQNLRNSTQYRDDANFVRKFVRDIDALILVDDKHGQRDALIDYISGDKFGESLAAFLKSLDAGRRQRLSALLWSAHYSDGPKPDHRFRTAMSGPLSDLDEEERVQSIKDILSLALNAAPSVAPDGAGRSCQYLNDNNIAVLKGIVWISGDYLDAEMIELLARLERRCLAKIPNRGAGARAVANAIQYLWATIPFDPEPIG